MLGLTYIRELYEMTMQELADNLGVSKQLISMWESGKKSISKDKLSKMSKLYNQSVEYFTQELTEVDKLEVEYKKIESQLNFEIDADGNKNYIINNKQDSSIALELEAIAAEIEITKLVQNIYESTLSKSVGYAERNIEVFTKLLTLISNEEIHNVNMKLVQGILDSLLIYYEIFKEEDLYNIDEEIPLELREMLSLNKEVKQSIFNLIKKAEKED